MSFANLDNSGIINYACRILRNLSLIASQDHFKRHNILSQITLILVIITNSWSIHNIVLCNHAIFLLLNQKTLISNIWALGICTRLFLHIFACMSLHLDEPTSFRCPGLPLIFPNIYTHWWCHQLDFSSAHHIWCQLSPQTLLSLSLSSSGKFSPTSLQWRLLKVWNQDGFPWCQLLLLVDGFSDSIEGESPLQLGNLGDVLALGGSLLL